MARKKTTAELLKQFMKILEEQSNNIDEYSVSLHDKDLGGENGDSFDETRQKLLYEAVGFQKLWMNNVMSAAGDMLGIVEEIEEMAEMDPDIAEELPAQRESVAEFMRGVREIQTNWVKMLRSTSTNMGKVIKKA